MTFFALTCSRNGMRGQLHFSPISHNCCPTMPSVNTPLNPGSRTSAVSDVLNPASHLFPTMTGNLPVKLAGTRKSATATLRGRLCSRIRRCTSRPLCFSHHRFHRTANRPCRLQGCLRDTAYPTSARRVPSFRQDSPPISRATVTCAALPSIRHRLHRAATATRSPCCQRTN